MLKKILKNKLKVGLFLLFAFALIAIRAFENQIFYDPFLDYFKSEYANLPLPKINVIKLFLSMGFRFYLNSMLSLGILYLLFRDTKIIKFSIFLYVVFGSLLFVSFFFILIKMGETNKMNLFYIRRFIIQPIFLLLFIPGFFLQKKLK